MTTFDDIYHAAQSLPAPDRIRLIDALWNTLPPDEWPPPNDDWIAEAQRRSAKLPQHQLSSATIETTRVAKRRQIRQDLSAAVETYGKLLSVLNEKQEASELSPIEQGILRNCYFAQADADFGATDCNAPQQITMLGHLRFDDLKSANHVAFKNDYLFVAAGLGGVKIVEVD